MKESSSSNPSPASASRESTLSTRRLEARKTAPQSSKTRDGLQVVIAIGRNERAATSWLSVATLTPRSGGSPGKVDSAGIRP